LKRVIIWVDSDDKELEEMLYKIKTLLGFINAKYTIVDVLDVMDYDPGGQ
jgi:hypothetical protein